MSANSSTTYYLLKLRLSKYIYCNSHFTIHNCG